MYERHILPELAEALKDTPVVFINGARQVGKSTLVKGLISSGFEATYVTLDDPSVLDVASTDPVGFLAANSDHLAIDEAQRQPSIFLPLKASVDADRRPGRYLLTGSANVLLLPHIAAYLVGRVQILTMWPLSQGEIERTSEGFVDALFANEQVAYRGSHTTRADIINRIVRGGYPDALARSAARRTEWFNSYITTVIERDVRDLASVERLAAFPRLLALLAARSAQLHNQSELSRSLGIPLATLRRYLAHLEATFLVMSVPAWTAGFGRRVVKSPKVYVVDTGLAAHVLGIDSSRLENQPDVLGALAETFVMMELRKQASWSRVKPALFHFRQAAGAEVDIVLESRSGDIVGVEVKASATVRSDDLRGMRALAESAKGHFKRGVVLYLGDRVLHMTPDIDAVPMSELWQAR